MSRRERTGITPALVVSTVLHVGGLAAVIILAPLFKEPFKLGGGVPVTLVASGPPEFMQAQQADENVEAQTEDPDPLLEPEPVPAVAPPTATPTPAIKPPVKPPVAPGKRPGRQAELDLDKLLSDVETAAPPKKPPRKSGGAKGPSRDPKAVQIGSGKKVSAATQGYLLNLGNSLSRRWNVNCLVEGGAVDAVVTFRIANGGRLLGPPTPKGSPKDQMAKVASERAIRAIYASEPFRDFPPELYGEELIYPFDAATACANR
jgi:hypothetical protein